MCIAGLKVGTSLSSGEHPDFIRGRRGRARRLSVCSSAHFRPSSGRTASRSQGLTSCLWSPPHPELSTPRDTAPLLRLRTPEDGCRRAARRRELPEVAPDTRATLPAPRRNVRSTPDGALAVQPPGLSYTNHWEVLPMPPHYYRDLAHGPGVGSGLLPRLPPPTCSRPVSGVGLGLFCSAASLLRSPDPCSPTVFRCTICDCLSLNGCFLSVRGYSVHPFCFTAPSLFPFGLRLCNNFFICSRATRTCSHRVAMSNTGSVDY